MVLRIAVNDKGLMSGFVFEILFFAKYAEFLRVKKAKIKSEEISFMYCALVRFKGAQYDSS